MKTAAATAVAAAALALAGQASASTEHYYSYGADNDAAKHRTQDIQLTLREGLMGRITVLRIYRSRGEDFGLKAVYPPWGERALNKALEGPPTGISFYQVDPQEGVGFARGACHGAEKAWLAMVPPKPYQPMRIVVLGDDAAAHAPVVCEMLDYQWRGEWQLPTKPNDSRRQEHGAERSF